MGKIKATRWVALDSEFTCRVLLFDLRSSAQICG